MKNIIKTVVSSRTGNQIKYVTYEGEKVDESVLKIVAEQGNCYPFLALLYLEAKKTGRVLELGICYGRATKSLLYGCRDGHAHLWSIDWGTHQTIQSVDEINKLGLEKWFTWMRDDFYKISPAWFRSNPMNLIWVDFDQCNYDILLERLVLAMRKGSILMLHNIDVGRGEREAILKYAEKPEFTYEEIHLGHGVGILRKVK